MMTIPPALSHPDPMVKIRPVRLHDVTSLQATCWPDKPSRWVYTMVSRARQQALQGRGLGIVVMGNTDHQTTLQAYGQLTLWLRAAEISDLIVAPAQRDQGIGTAMIQYLVRAAREMQARRVEIGAEIENTRALALYRRLGFQPAHRIQTPDDPPKTIQYLLLEIHSCAS
jgi:ribosomal protein S18 acetylase RimI-like enzyme